MPWSLMMSSGNLKYLYLCFNMSSAVLKAVGSLGSGIRWSNLENQSKVTLITVFLGMLGSSKSKISHKDECKMGPWTLGRGTNLPIGTVHGILDWAQTVQKEISLNVGEHRRPPVFALQQHVILMNSRVSCCW